VLEDKQEIVLVALFERTAILLVQSVQADVFVALSWPGEGQRMVHEPARDEKNVVRA
jgi:hypothetical protein